MKIEVKERGSKAYYDEFMYVASYYRKFQKNPGRKIRRMTRFLLSYELLVLFAIAAICFFYFIYPDRLYVFLLGMLALVLLMSVLLHYRVEKRIQEIMKAEDTKIITIDEEQIGYEDSEKEFRIRWDEVMAVLSGPHLICFLPKGKDGVLISVCEDQKEEVMAAIREAGREGLVIGE